MLFAANAAVADRAERIVPYHQIFQMKTLIIVDDRNYLARDS